MIGWLLRRADARVERQAQAILAALGDGSAHYVYNDLERRTGIHAASMWPALDRLEDRGLVESGWADTASGRRRRWYRIAQPGDAR